MTPRQQAGKAKPDLSFLAQNDAVETGDRAGDEIRGGGLQVRDRRDGSDHLVVYPACAMAASRRICSLNCASCFSNSATRSRSCVTTLSGALATKLALA